MPKIGRPGLSREKRAELGKRWKNGHCASDIARALERTKGAIHHVLAFNGGIAPAARRRGQLEVVVGIALGVASRSTGGSRARCLHRPDRSVHRCLLDARSARG